MLKLTKIALITATLVSTSAFAGVNGNDTYLGLGFGQSQMDPELKDGSDSSSDRDLAIQAFLGHDLNENFGIELNYADLGEHQASDIGFDVTSLQGVVNLPSNDDQLSVYGKLGVSYINPSKTTNTPYDVDYDTEISGAVGARWNLGENWFARAEYNYYNEDLQAAFLQFAYAWGAEDQVVPVVVPPVEPKEPEVEYVLVSIADAQSLGAIFDFDSAKINDPTRLDEIASVLTESQGQIVVRAHTDSIGSEAYNQKLSEERAQSAVNYFVSKGIPAERFLAQGMGESSPVSTNDTKEGRAENRRLEVGYTIEKEEVVSN